MLRCVSPQEIFTERITKSSFWTAGFVCMAAICALFAFVWWEAFPSFQSQGLGLIFGNEWSIEDGLFGALPMILGSIFVTITALVLAVPLGLSAAIVTSEMFPSRFRPIPKFLMEILAGIPSVVYGLIGIAVLVPWLQGSQGLLTGRTLLTGGIILGVMILPTLTTLAEDALKAVPRERREAGWSLGLTKMETILHCVIHDAKSGILAALLLAVGRALGETIAVMLLVGSLDRIPSPWYNWLVPGQTLTSKIGREATEAVVGSAQYSALAALGLILLLAVMALTFSGRYLMRVGMRSR